jgi:hypothetical protein
MLRLAFAVAAVLLVPAQAQAFEGFVGVTERGSLVRFSSQNPYVLSSPKRVLGLAPGERIVALGKSARGVVGVGSSARLYAIDLATARATAIGAPFAQGLRGSRFSLAVAPRGDRARLLSDVGQDLVVDLATGVTADGPGLRSERDGAQVRPAADMTPNGSLVGVQLNPDVLLREVVSGSTTMAQMPLASPRGVPIGEPLAFQLGEDGAGYLVTVLTEALRDRQSVLTVVDPSTGGRFGPVSRQVQFFGRRIDTFAALGPVARDRRPPRIGVRLPRRVSVRALLARKLPLRVTTSEGGQATVSLQVAGRAAGLAFVSRDTPGALRFYYFAPTPRERARLRAGVGRNLRVRVRVSDLKGNSRFVIRMVRLTR